LHLCIQLPGLYKYKFRWYLGFGLRDTYVKRVIRLLLPRLVTMLFIQLIFLVRDNLASRLSEGAVTALAYGWMFQQVPETLIGTAIGTALLPTISEQFSKNDELAFRETIQKAIKVIVAITIPISVVYAIALRPLIEIAFNFGVKGTNLLFYVTFGYLLGLAGHSLVEINARAFYARQDAITPLFGAILNVFIYITIGSILYKPIGAIGISITDAIAFTAQAIFLFYILKVRNRKTPITIGRSVFWAIFAAISSGSVSWLLMNKFIAMNINLIVNSMICLVIGVIIAIPFVWKDAKNLLNL